jgi:hypothetical protein
MDEPLEYQAAHLNEALASDPRVSELGLHITVKADRLYVTGTVTTAERRSAIDEVLAELAAGYEIHNETAVPCLAEPPDAEKLR